jgi:uridine kinase
MFVIAITGHSGAGKTTLIGELVRRLGEAVSLSLDSYETSSTFPPGKQWLEAGADPNQFLTPQFVEDVRKLRNGTSIIHPETGVEVKPTRYLILEEHFGRGRDAVRPFIDFVILIDLPLEIAHVRKLLRKNDFLPWEDDPAVFIDHMRQHLNWYLRVGRDFYLAVHNIVRKDCDLIVNGNQSAAQMAEEILNAVTEKQHDNDKGTNWGLINR